LGQSGGAETVTLTTSQIPAHSHVPQCFSTQGNLSTPGGPPPGVWALSTSGSIYADTPPPSISMAAAALGSSGGSQPHDNMIPFLVINFILSLFGIFPSQT
jgi:microcystin-dependent protein